MKLFHLADIHLDAAFLDPPLPPEYGEARRLDIRETVASVFRRAWEEQPAAVLFAGDLFASKYVTPETVTFFRELCERSNPIPILITPGNNDPFTEDSPYAIVPWPENVVIFDRPEWQCWHHPDLPLAIHGFGYRTKDTAGEIFCRLRVPRDGRFHVAVGHGTERNHGQEGVKPRATFSLSDILQPGLHYLALGHVHRLEPVAREDRFQAWYPGPPEPLDFDESGPRGFLEVTFDGQAEQDPRIETRFRSATIHRVQEISIDIAETDPDTLMRLFTAVESPADTMVLLRLQGEGHLDTRAALLRTAAEHRESFRWFGIHDETRCAVPPESFRVEDTVLGDFCRMLNQELEAAPDAASREKIAMALQAGIAALSGQPWLSRIIQTGDR
ncbi:MAG: DNA repair exonuclease [Candidatus Hydrogenedentes bacterium]|nr:DNA repair exonuclease [Candidatus Hydrogenedentota bacterium]HOJ67640.1 DNA repair exonuclease [Candidatus Hydrogenedentota bacterium]